MTLRRRAAPVIKLERDIMWAPWEGPGLEHLRLIAEDEAVTADSVIIGLYEDRPFRIRYTIRCDATWSVREVDVGMIGPGGSEIHLRTDGRGQWTAADGQPLPALAGCIDVDLSATAFTNTLPIRRLGLGTGESADLSVVYIDAPTLDVSSVRQRYECRRLDPAGALYWYESLPYEALPDGFVAELPVDPDGLVLDYPGLFRRVWDT
jgi:uncharacterized protein